MQRSVGAAALHVPRAQRGAARRELLLQMTDSLRVLNSFFFWLVSRWYFLARKQLCGGELPRDVQEQATPRGERKSANWHVFSLVGQ